jgi:hypothetical protein
VKRAVAGTSASFAAPLVYNMMRSGTFTLARRRLLLRRVPFPKQPPPEWFVVDLRQHAEQATGGRDDLTAAIGEALAGPPVRPLPAADDKRRTRIARHTGTRGGSAPSRWTGRRRVEIGG